MKPSKRDIYEKLEHIEGMLRQILRKLNPDFKNEDDAVRAMSSQISEAASHLPPQTSPTPTEGNK